MTHFKVTSRSMKNGYFETKMKFDRGLMEFKIESILAKTSIFESKFDFRVEIIFSSQNTIFESKFDFRVEITFSSQNRFFGPNTFSF